MSEHSPVKIHYFDVTENEHGQRVDNYLFTRLKNVPQSHIYRLIRRGEIRVDKKRCRPSGKLSSGNKVRVPLRESDALTGHKPTLDKAGLADVQGRILYEDEFLLAVDKRAGEVIHSGSRHSYGLVDQLNQLRMTADIRPLHRLDRGTTGCVVFAKSRPVMLALHKAFREHKVKKVYQALVAGRWDANITHMLSHDEKTAKPIETRFRIMRCYRHQTLLEVCPVTGRKHQIRKQTAAAGHPIIGDRLYGCRANDKQLPSGRAVRLFLHAWKLSFTLDGTPYSFESPPPGTLKEWAELHRPANQRKAVRPDNV